MFRKKAPPRPKTVFDRFGPLSRHVVVAAEAQARADGSDAIEVHHLLLAATSVPSPAGWALATEGLDEAVLRDALERRCGVPLPAGDERVPFGPRGDEVRRIPFTDAAKDVLGDAVLRARSEQPRATIEPQDLAVAALRSGAPTIVAVLDDLGLDPAVVIAALP